MDDLAFDRALVAAAFDQAATRGWGRLNIVDAARSADLKLDRVRARFPARCMVLVRFGELADQAALAGLDDNSTPRDRLFDAVMRRIDVLQAHRAGMLALLRWLPTHPVIAASLAALSLRSMVWLLQGAGIAAVGPVGVLRAKGLLAVWLWTVRAWQTDASEDLSATMAALDRALDRAEQAESSLADLLPRPLRASAASAGPPADEESGPDAPFEPPPAPSIPPSAPPPASPRGPDPEPTQFS